MYLNTFSSDLEPLDLTGLEEFASLLDSARDLDIEVPDEVRYISRNTVLRHQRFHFLEWGREDAPPVVLLHGGNQSAHSWDLVSLHLSSDCRVMALDQRGHGDSEWNRGAHYAIADMMPDARDFFGALGLARPVVVGQQFPPSHSGEWFCGYSAVREKALRRLFIVKQYHPGGFGDSG